ncbi:MAG: hypothetical protein QXH17_10140, partial [Candidatus Bathyarchaeia archaeon]
VAYPYWSKETVLQGLAPDIVKEHIGHIELAYLNCTHGNNAHQDEGLHLEVEVEKICEEANGEKSYCWPEEDLEEGKDVPLCHDPVLEDKGIGLCNFIS